MPRNWESCKTKGQKYSNRWGHSSTVMKEKDLILFGGYAQSKFMNDVWVYNNSRNDWSEVRFEENNPKPVQRSNCSLVYSEPYRGMIMFGGGSIDSSKLNDLWLLIIEEGTAGKGYKGLWKQLYPQCCKVPWGRTYHVGEIYSNYLIIHGGESYAGEVGDCWTLDLESLQWMEMHFVQKQAARKFHSSSIINSKLYLIGGVHSNYQPISKIQFTDISIFDSHDIEKIEQHSFEWHTVKLSENQTTLISRWGHVAKSFENKVFIFGGRTTVEQNDLLLFDPEAGTVNKVSCLKEPQPRRKPSAWVVGSNFIIASGYNGNYLNDQWFIDLRFLSKSSMKHIFPQQRSNINERNRCDIHINTLDNKYVNISTKLIKSSFQSQQDMINLLQELGAMNYTSASKLCSVLQSGVFKAKTGQDTKHEKTIFSDKRIPQPEESIVNEKLLKDFNVTFSQNEQLANKKKILYNVVEQSVVIDMQPLRVVKVTQVEFKRIINTIIKDCFCDLKIVFSKQTRKIHNFKEQNLKEITCCKLPLIARSDYFKNAVEQSERRQKQQNKNPYDSPYLTIEMNIHKKQVDLLKIIILYCYYGHVILPKSFSLFETLELYKLSRKYSLSQMQVICFEEIKNSIMSKEFQDCIKENLSNEKKLFITAESLSSNKLDCGQQFISSKQFDDLLTFCVKQSKVQTQRKSSQMNKNKWFELFEYILKVFTEICLKKVVIDVRAARYNESLSKRRHLKNNKDTKQNNLSENKQNSLGLKNYQRKMIQLNPEKQFEQDHMEVITKPSTFSRIQQLVMQQIGKPLVKNSQSASRIIMSNKQIEWGEEFSLDESIFRMIRRCLNQERKQGEFRFKYILSEII